ncbi:MBL fold metallo-hydrolase [Rhizohabitans arisaemae]|uniref:MBL fold metallo-hydrolase n=1 Tax=Rhizohabitans arisaemae TaxID=2720610 RepID=UPI0024B2174A|nr:MBL fold metallo-hydrolase [Rhizohabitans arisaemae]
MSRVIDLGGIKVHALNDGVVHLPPMYYPGLDFDAHPGLLAADGTYHIPVGCFLIRGEGFTVLVDAGLGPSRIPFPAEIAAAAGLTDPPETIAQGGLLPGALAEAGVAPEDVTTVFLTHLHADHIGWIAPDGALYFPNAVVMCGDADWRTTPTAPAPGEMEGRAGLKVAEDAGVLRTVTAPAVELAPGVTARHSPGHTPGHYVVSASSGGEGVYLLGDAVHHPLQLNDQGISFLSEEEPEHALRAREELFAALEGREVSIGMTHFPGLEFQRITTTENGRRWTTTW